MADKPTFQNAPGLQIRQRRGGAWLAFWQCRTDLAKRGFQPRIRALWMGETPSDADRVMISEQCNMLQSEMLVFGRGGVPELGIFDGTVGGLIRCYQTDADFLKLRFQTRRGYKALCARLDDEHGDERIADLSVRDIIEWHREWSSSGIPMAHALIRMFRGLLSHGMSMLEDEACEKLSIRLGKKRFEMGKARSETLSAEQAIAIRAEAHRQGHAAIALAQAIQFDGMLRQKDVIGEYVPLGEPGTSEVMLPGSKWLYGLRWSELDANLICRHITSKRQKPVELDFRLMPMVLDELKAIYGLDLAVELDRAKLPASGPVIIYTETNRPYGHSYFRTLWRRFARAAGVPDNVRNMDSRSGAITEATSAGAPLEDVRHAATHSNISMTQRYSREAAEKSAGVMRMRAAHRKNKSGT